MNFKAKKNLARLALCFAVASGSSANTNTAIIFVHGAHFNANAWQLVQTKLNNQIPSYAVNLPGRNDNILAKKISLELSAASLCSFLATIPNEKMIVAHSQGGAVVNASLSICPEETVRKVVYLSAVAPLNGDGVFSKLNKTDETHYFSGVHYNEQEQLMEISNPTNFANSFAQDATPEQKTWLLANAFSEPAFIGEGKVALNRQRFDSIEKYYIFAKQDQIISLESQQNIANDLNLKGSFEINSGHLPMLTNSQELTNLLVKIREI